ncbi:3-oxoacyl-[acyl-carrier-protein] synthase III C-terminal domain-containing protein [Virgibacillus sp. C22-A2]|uniref:3-oxoacyl-[acyl-carrier-protein] synthase III C-terminal domain-containing protein n=1 Tax=Virgibacillus tibetensis TaxID=3042313 RepID=A0ABU6KBI2_9BACI|nr:3-oxoacyl-[acyl-carrier-protein] synthase III C-terminal domain-containing protein [Virgibacillus sp. C22-A2]
MWNKIWFGKGDFMTYICSTGIGIPKYTLKQNEVKQLVKEVFIYSEKQINRLLPVFDNAQVTDRQFVVEKDWFKEKHSFQERNDLYQNYSKEYALKAIDNCLSNSQFLTTDIPYEAIDMIIYVSSTGIATPSMDVHLLNERPFRQDVNRMPLWGLGCAGGAIGLSRAHDWITSHPEKTALLICCELCSLTFQKGDMKKSNMIGTALFGDGISATLVTGDQSPYLSYRRSTTPKIMYTSSLTKRNSTSVMGWKVTNSGLEVVFSKSIPALVDSFWVEHINAFLRETELTEEMIHSFIAHPGGKKVLDAMERVLQTSAEKLSHSYNVLNNHGNMSSATVMYVLGEWMKQSVAKNEKSILSALGPGFSSELILLEWG